MAKIELCKINKSYGKIEALKDISLVIDDKEFLVLFGPAGAGKTTILKLIAGIELPTTGEVRMNGENVNMVETSERNVAMVFENYALYPQMTAYDNIAFPLRSKLYKQPEEVIKEKVTGVAQLLKIDMLLDRLPSQMSNGQKQRVALGRSLVRNPNIFLMDEPLAHLDAKMRHFMRNELKEMQTTLNTTTLYVTHDYMEALSLGDRIAIINNGKIEQIGKGKEIYHRPANEFVAKLVGEPEINIFPIDIEVKSDSVWMNILGMHVQVTGKNGTDEILGRYDNKQVDFGIRAQYIQCYFKKPDWDCIKGKVYSFEPIGNKAILIVDVNGTQLRTTVSNDLAVKLNTDIYVGLRVDKALYFDRQSKQRITTARLQQAGLEG